MVHQHFRLVAPFTVAENVILGEHRDGGARVPPPPARDRARRRRARRALRDRRRSARADLAALGRRAAAGRDPEGALPRGADPDPRRADRRAHAAGGGRALRDAADDGRRGPDGDLHLAQAARGEGGRRPRHRAARRPRRSRRVDDRRRDAARARRADGRPRGRARAARRAARAAAATRSALEVDGLCGRGDRGEEAVRGRLARPCARARSSASPASPATASASSPRRSPGCGPPTGGVVRVGGRQAARAATRARRSPPASRTFPRIGSAPGVAPSLQHRRELGAQVLPRARDLARARSCDWRAIRERARDLIHRYGVATPGPHAARARPLRRQPPEARPRPRVLGRAEGADRRLADARARRRRDRDRARLPARGGRRTASACC